MMIKPLTAITMAAALLLPSLAAADDYVIDTEGAHAFVPLCDNSSKCSGMPDNTNDRKGLMPCCATPRTPMVWSH